MAARVAICAITFQRPHGLAALLRGIAELKDPGDADVRVVIVDNDPAGSAAAVVEEWRSTVPWPIDHAVEPRRGIPFARNRAVELAAGRDVVFIDDDEVPDPAWLVELLAARDRTGADIVTGPVLPVFEAEPPPWLAPFFERPRFHDDAPIGYARTSSVLISAGALPPGEAAFSERFALTGGSDTHLFMRTIARGSRIVWADRAVVHETMPASRLSARWVLRREYRRGNTLSLCLRDLHDTWPARAKRLARSALEAVTGIVQLATSPARGGRGPALRGAQRVALAAGMVAGLFNVRYDEYAVIHGR